MSKYYSLLGGTTTDTEIQVAQENQIVIGRYAYAYRQNLQEENHPLKCEWIRNWLFSIPHE